MSLQNNQCLGRKAPENLTEDGRARLVRHGHLPEREIMTGIGPVAMRCPRVRDRVGKGLERIGFSSAILPPYARRSKSFEVLIPILYLKGISSAISQRSATSTSGPTASGCRRGEHDVVDGARSRQRAPIG